MTTVAPDVVSGGAAPQHLSEIRQDSTPGGDQ
jgi:hypothetical protein